MLDDLRADIEAALDDKYCELRHTAFNGHEVVVGSFPIWHENVLIDRFQIEISLGETYPTIPPTLVETGNRIPRIDERHNSDRGACLFVPIEWMMRRPNLKFLTFLDGPVREYFLAQKYYEQNGEWPFSSRSHGEAGRREALCDLAGIQVQNWSALSDILEGPEPKGHWRCPCGNGKRLRTCHGREISELFRRLSKFSSLEREALGCPTSNASFLSRRV